MLFGGWTQTSLAEALYFVFLAAAYRRAAVDKGFLRPGPVAVALHNVQRRTGA